MKTKAAMFALTALVASTGMATAQICMGFGPQTPRDIFNDGR